MDVDGTTQGETHEQETKHRVWAEVDLEKHCKIDVDGTPHGETREQEVKRCDWASVETLQDQQCSSIRSICKRES